METGVKFSSLIPKLVLEVWSFDSWAGGVVGGWEYCSRVTVAVLLFPKSLPVISTISYTGDWTAKLQWSTHNDHITVTYILVFNDIILYSLLFNIVCITFVLVVFTYLVFSCECLHNLERRHTTTSTIDAKNRMSRRTPEVILIANTTSVNLHVSTDDCSTMALDW